MDTTGKNVKIYFKIKDAQLNRLLYDNVKQFNLKINQNNYKLQIQFEFNGFDLHKIIGIKEIACIPIDIHVHYISDERVVLSKNFYVEELSVCSLDEDTDNILCTITFTNVKL